MKSCRRIYLLQRQITSLACVRSIQNDGASSISSKIKGYSYKSQYNIEEQNHILQTLNKSSTGELARFDISKARIQSIRKFRNKCGQFHNLNQVLEVEGLGVKVLERLCDSIITSTNDQERDGTRDGNTQKEIKRNRTPMVTPSMTALHKNMCKRVVGLHIAANTVCWAALTCEGELLHWDLYELQDNLKKQHPTTLLEMALTIHAQLPKGDIYVMEDMMFGQPVQQSVYNLQYWQLRSILLTLLNTTTTTTTDSDETVTSPLTHHHRVFFLRSCLAARLFHTLVGSEKVSTQAVVARIISSQHDAHYSPITMESDVRYYYMSRNSVEKELLSETLLLSMSFMDLVLNMKPESIKYVRNRNKDKA